jgi:hypothetical protein
MKSRTKFESEARSVYVVTMGVNMASHTEAITVTKCDKEHGAQENI